MGTIKSEWKTGRDQTDRQGAVGDPSLISSRKSVMAKVKEEKNHEKEEEGKVLIQGCKGRGQIHQERRRRCT